MRIAKKISLSFLITAVILTAVVVVILFAVVRVNLANEIFSHLSTAVKSRADHIRSVLEGYREAVELMASGSGFGELLSISENNPEYSTRLDGVNKQINTVIQVHGDILRISILDGNGTVVASTDKASGGSDKSSEQVYVKTGESVSVGDVHISETSGMPALDVTAPVLLNGESMGSIVAEVTMERLFDIIQERTGLGKTGEIYLINKDAYMISPSRFREDVFLELRVDTENARHCMAHEDEKHQHEAMSVFPDYRGINVLGTHEYISEMKWGLLAEIDAAEAFAPLRSLAYLFGSMLVFIPLAAWVIGHIVSAKITGPIHKLHQGTEIIGKGNLDLKVGTDAEDEIGQLSRAFDGMTTELQNTFTSIDDLNREIATRRQAEEALLKSEEKFRTVTTSAQEAIIILDNGGKITFWNTAAEKIFDRSGEEVMGRDLHSLFAPERYHAAFMKGFKDFRKTGKGNAVGKTLELSALRKDGTEFPVEISLAGVNLEGRWNAIGIVRDISARKQAEELLLRAKETAETANRAKSEFLANMSHEIRTPMNGIIGMTDLMMDSELTPEQRDYAETIGRSAESLLAIINDILDFSKIEAGKMDLEILDFDLRTALEDLNRILAVKAQEKGLEYVCLIEPEVPSLLQGDPGRLRQVLTNLVGNAVKFTSRGEVSLRVAVKEEQESRVLLRFSVSDTGIGIPEDRVESLFESFTQADASTTRKYGGTGLGLAISRQMVEMMEGEIGVERREGGGSTFWFTARFAKQPSGREAVGRATEGAAEDMAALLTGMRILVVDDNATSRLVLKGQLDSWGCRHEEVPDADTALEKLRTAAGEGDPFGLAILDMQMPGTGGESLGRMIKEEEAIKGTFLIMMTSAGSRGDAARLKEIGFSAYLNKPVRQSQLYDCLAAVLGERPEEPARPRAMVTRHSLAEWKRRRVRVLIAEDNPTNRKVALAILEKLGYRADAVANGQEAVQALETLPYDLVLMDVQMPEMDGFEATERIRDERSSVRNHRIPIIAMTAHALKGDREKCLEAGMDDYVSKPVRPQELADAIERSLARAGSWERKAPGLQRTKKGKSFDENVLKECLSGDEELIASILEGYLRDAPHQIEVLKESQRIGSASEMERQAHSLKSASASVGAVMMQEIAAKIEAASRSETDGDTDALEITASQIQSLEQAFKELKDVLNEQGIT